MKRIVPFGLLYQKPRHFRDIFKVLWENRDNFRYGWKVLSRGVCDGCALGVSGFHDWTIDGIHLCMTRLNLLRLNTMAAFDYRLLENPQGYLQVSKLSNAQLRTLGRIPYPLSKRKGEDHFTRISWEQALSRVAEKIKSSSPRRIAFYLTSRAITNEVYYVAQKVARFLGTNNIDNAARLCHSPSTVAMKNTLGTAASTCSYRDWIGTDLIVIFGANPANDQPVTTKYFVQAKRRGTKIALVNPLREPGMERYWVPSDWKSAILGTKLTDHWFPVAHGGDIAFIYGTLKFIFEKGWEEVAFLSSRTNGFSELKAFTERLSWVLLEQSSGLTKAQFESFATLLRGAKNAVFIWSMGITQHAFGGDNVQMILNLGLVRGFVGRPLNGFVPIRGHSGVQGGAEMGAYATVFPGGLPISSGNAQRLAAQYRTEVPDWVGLTAPEMVEAASRHELDLLYCIGGNFLRTLPDPDYVKAAMSRVPLRVHQDIMLTDQIFMDATEEVILLPAKTRYEQEGGGTETTTERRVIFSPEISRKIGETRSEWRILRDLLITVDPAKEKLFGCGSGKAIRQEIARVIPLYEGIQELERSGKSFQYGGHRLFDNGPFATPDGKAHLRPVLLPSSEKREGVFELSTRRGKQFNTLIYSERDPLTGADRDAIFMNPDDAATFHLKQGDRICLRNDTGRFEGSVFLVPIAKGNLQIHWPEGNVIIGKGRKDTLGGVPDYNTQVRIESLP